MNSPLDDFVSQNRAKIRPKITSYHEDLACIQVWNNYLIISIGYDRLDDCVSLWMLDDDQQLKQYGVLRPKGTIYDMNTIELKGNSAFVLYGGSSEGHLQIWTTHDMKKFSSLWLTMETTNRDFTPICVWNKQLVSHSLKVFGINLSSGIPSRSDVLPQRSSPAHCILAVHDNLLVTSHELGQITYWSQQKKERTFKAHQDAITSLCLWRNHVVSSSRTEIKIWNEEGICIRTLTCDDNVNCMCVWGDLLCCGCGFVSASRVIDSSVMLHCAQPLQIWTWDGLSIPVHRSGPPLKNKKKKLSVHDCGTTHLVVWGSYLCSASFIDQRVCIWECMYCNGVLAYLLVQLPWSVHRVLWLGWKDKECILSLLPKELIKVIVGILNSFPYVP